MLNWINEFWKKYKGEIIVGLIVTVVGGIIPAAILSLSPQLRGLAIKGLEKIQTEVAIPLYWLLTMFAFGVLVTRVLIWKANKKTKTLSDYDRDEVSGFVWEWDDYKFDSKFKPLCPKCLAELLFAADGSDRTHYRCISCGFKKNCNMDHHILLKFVEIEIDKRIRTGDWKQAEKRITEIKNKT
jgi:hypothetical protein